MGTDPEAAPCVGEPVMTRACNESPCPPPKEEKEEEEVLPLKIKMERYSTRP